MNLVKAQELAKGMGPAELKKFANGFAPDLIPPWLATGEIQAQMQRAQKMQAMQGGVQGPQPSVKEQIEQKAGLMGLQMAQQKMAQQQQMGQMGRRPPAGPVPEGTPEPEMQPDPEMMMARGGLASVPVKFNYDGGGIVAFTSGGDVDSAREAAKEALAKVRTYGLAQRKNDPSGYQAAQAALEKAQSALAAVEAAYAKEMSAAGADRPARGAKDVGGLKQLMAAEPTARESIIPYGQSKATNVLAEAPPRPPAPPRPSWCAASDTTNGPGARTFKCGCTRYTKHSWIKRPCRGRSCSYSTEGARPGVLTVRKPSALSGYGRDGSWR
jgi:hypothetical protein